MSNIAVLTEFGREQKKKGSVGSLETDIFFFFALCLYTHKQVHGQQKHKNWRGYYFSSLHEKFLMHRPFGLPH